MSSHKTISSLTSDCIDCFYKNIRGLCFFGGAKKVSHTACSISHKHFHEFASCHREESNTRFSCCCTSEKSFASTTRPYHEDSFWRTCTHCFIFSWVFQEVYNLC